MKPILFIALLAVFSHALSEKCTDEKTVKKTKWTEFHCANGQWVPVACLAFGKRFENGEVETFGHLIVQCRKISPSTLAMVAIACSAPNGHVVAPTATVTIGHQYYKCMPKLGSLSLEVAGCVGPTGEQLPLGTLVAIEQYVYQCQLDEDVASLLPYGCIYRGKTVLLNDTVIEPDYWRICRLDEDHGIVLDFVGGCVDVSPNHIFHSQGLIYKCLKENDKFSVKAVGCLEVTSSLMYVEHMVGEQWFEGKDAVKYEMECAQDMTGVFMWAKRCLFQDDDLRRNLWLEPMCMKRINNKLYQCVRGDNQRLRSTIVENVTDTMIEDSKNNSIEFCD